jgi:hypothetical protein
MANSSTLIMEDGVVQNCSAFNGGGIYIIDSYFTMNGGTIKNNSNYMSKGGNLPSGGGVYIGGNGVMTFNGGTIEGNKASEGGGIAVGGYYFHTSSDSVENFIMNGGTITNNSATTCGGGIFLQASYSGTINAGYITDNYTGSGNFGGGGIYVNGGASKYTDGIMRLYNVCITDNNAGYEGGGIAGCSTSYIQTHQEDGSVIYGNTANGKKDDILVSNSNGAGATTSKPTTKYLSALMLNGEPSDWRYVSTGASAGVNYLHADGSIHIYANVTADSESVKDAVSSAKVFITGNEAKVRGGGIGTNGVVIIGKDSTTTEMDYSVQVTKKWVDENNAYNTRPSRIWIWLLRNGEKIGSLEYRQDDLEGTLAFGNLPLEDENGEAYVYTIEEDSTGIEGVYTSEIKKNSDESYTVTNTLITKRDFEFTKTDESGTAFGNGDAEFKLYSCSHVHDDSCGALAEGGTCNHTHSDLVSEETGNCWAELSTSSTDKNGKVSFKDLETGDYMLVETKTKSGYQLPDGQWLVHIEAIGNKVTITAHGDMPPAFKVTEANNVKTYSLPNYKVMTPPLSGGRGTIIFTVIGVILLSTAEVMHIVFARKKRKMQRV